MALISNTVETYGRTNIPENVASQKLYYFEREETPILSTSTKVNAESTTVEWTEDTLNAASGSNFKIEGDVLTVGSRPQVTRRKNYTQIFTKGYSVTGTSQAVGAYGYTDQMAFERGKASRELKRDIETTFVQNQISATGASGTARKCFGLESIISTNASRGVGGAGTGYNSGTGITAVPTDGTQRGLTQSIVDTIMKTSYDNGIDKGSKRWFMANSTQIQAFTNQMTGNQSRITMDANQATNNVSIYQTPFGTVTTMLNPQMRQRTAIILDPKHVNIAVLRDFKTQKLPQTNDSMEETWIYEATTLVREKGHAIIADLT